MGSESFLTFLVRSRKQQYQTLEKGCPKLGTPGAECGAIFEEMLPSGHDGPSRE